MAGSRRSVGVSGHIKIADSTSDQLAEAVRSVLQNEGDVVAYSALAEGADRIFANVALELGLPLVGVLTCPVERFIEDFRSEESVAEFRELLSRCSEVVHAYEGLPEQENVYIYADSYLCRTCDLVVVLWDGKATNHAAGTARVVEMRRGEGAAPLFAGDHRGEIIQVRTPRQGDSPEGAGDIIRL